MEIQSVTIATCKCKFTNKKHMPQFNHNWSVIIINDNELMMLQFKQNKTYIAHFNITNKLYFLNLF